MSDLAHFQRQFADALLNDEQAPATLRSQAFAVYRNTAARGTVEALRATFPTVDLLVGDEMFSQLALDFRRDQPPASPVLSDYGDSFAAWLSRQPFVTDLPYLSDVARLDWLWLQSFLARDADAPAFCSPEAARIAIHPAARFAWLATPAMSIWLAHRDPWDAAELELDWVEEGALFTRIGGTVRAERTDADFHQLLLAAVAPRSIADLVTSVAAACPAADVPQLLQHGVATGALIIL